MTALYRVHAIMISLATVFCAGFSGWSFQHPDEGPAWMGAFFGVSSVALAAYLVKFLKDKRD
jgi:hypothetical protein